MNTLPLDGLVVLEFSQYLSAPSAGLRLADLGARVIKIERPGTGDAGRKLAIKNLWADDNSLLFHTINRNKESFTANLKDPEELELIKRLISRSDVLIHNFRPGVMEKTGLGYETLAALNPRLIYAEISGYGTDGPWKNKPGQDLLLQSLTGLTYTTGNAGQAPVPFGIAIADILCGAQLVQGVLAALIRRQKTGQGALIQASLMESMLDFQFELLTTYYADGHQPQRSSVNNGHTLLSAPYGLYRTSDGYLALAMMDIQALGEALECPSILRFTTDQVFSERDAIKQEIATHLDNHPTVYWLQKLQARGLWAMEVLNWQQMREQDAYKALNMEQTVHTLGRDFVTTRCPVRIDGRRFTSSRPAPQLGEHRERIIEELINPS